MKYHLQNNPIANSFSKAATNYANHSALQNEINTRLIDRAKALNLSPKTILDLGSGTGSNTKKLATLYPNANIIGLDIAIGMTSFAINNNKNSNLSYLCATAENLPLKERSIDLIFSNCTIHWVNELVKAFLENLRILQPNGVFLFSAFGEKTLFELKKSWCKVDKFSHVNNFVSLQNLGDLLLKSDYRLPVVDREEIILSYSSVKNLLQELKGLGSYNLANQKNLSLFSKGQLNSLEQIYSKLYGNNNRIPATFEVIYGIAWKGKEHRNINEGTCFGNTTIKVSS